MLSAERLADATTIEPGFWLDLQIRYDLEKTSAARGDDLDRIESFVRLAGPLRNDAAFRAVAFGTSLARFQQGE